MKDNLTPDLPSNEEQDKQFLFAAAIGAFIVITALVNVAVKDLVVSGLLAAGALILLSLGTYLSQSRQKALNACGALLLVVVVTGVMTVVK